jgi:hypothetical protein
MLLLQLRWWWCCSAVAVLLLALVLVLVLVLRRHAHLAVHLMPYRSPYAIHLGRRVIVFIVELFEHGHGQGQFGLISRRKKCSEADHVAAARGGAAARAA